MVEVANVLSNNLGRFILFSLHSLNGVLLSTELNMPH